MYDIVILSVPYVEATAPVAAPALLKGYLQTQGFMVKAIDWNVEMRRYLADETVYAELIPYWTGVVDIDDISESTRSRYQQALDHFADVFANLDTRWLGLGLFSHHSHRCCTDLLVRLHAHDVKPKIVLGGHGLDLLYAQEVDDFITTHIFGEGELALRALLSGQNDYPGIAGSPVQIENLDQLGHADYSDYDLSSGYDQWFDGPMIQITGSRGCVRSCTFCDVAAIWPRYRYRSGQSLAHEMIKNHEATGVNYFYFTDSLINGNLKQLMAMMAALTDYKQRTGSKISWGGQWIVRTQKGLPKNYYELIASSGGMNIAMGVESGSESVRAHMKKNFTNQDLDDTMEQFSRHGITCGFLILLGYPTESEEDFQETLRMFKRYVKYVADGTIIGVSVGSGFTPLPNTPIMRDGKDFVILESTKTKAKWVSTTTNSNYLENVRRRLIAQKVLNNLMWPASNIEFEFKTILKNQQLLFGEKDRDAIDSLLQDKSLTIAPEFDVMTEPQDFDLALTLVGNKGLSWPRVKITINGRSTVHEIKGTQILHFAVHDRRRRNLVKIELINKLPRDTVLDHGCIVGDKSVEVNAVEMLGSRLKKSWLATHAQCRSQQRQILHNATGLFSQGDLFSLYFENPLHAWLIRQRRFYFQQRREQAQVMIDKVMALYLDHVNAGI